MKQIKDIKVVHITTVHPRFDSRIFYKECCSLANNGFDITLIVADGKGDEEVSGVKIIDVGLENNRIKKLFCSTKKAYNKAKNMNADIYQFHDPDFLPYGVKLKKKNNKVFFDSHEDFPALMKQRDYIPSYLRKFLFWVTTSLEKYCTKRISGVVTVTEKFKEKFDGYGVKEFQTIKNYPIISSLEEDKENNTLPINKKTVCYVGGLTAVRGVKEMVLASYNAGVKLLLAGAFDSESYYDELKNMKEWVCVEFLGYVPHDEVLDRIYSRSFAGLVVLHDAPNHKNSIPIKLLEYMSAGLPVIATKDIDFCKEVVGSVENGIVVDPKNINQISEAINNIMSNPVVAEDMKEKGLNAVKNVYNWNIEEKKLIELYLR